LILINSIFEGKLALALFLWGIAYPSLALPLERGGNKISSLPPLQGGIKGGFEICGYKEGEIKGNLL
jgi:hypothetical protein